ncbi:Uma2 family endonuclease [Tundrisphaera lichenicola]|uniref:Uma2 family endonuclease n=1 Tax=Tundrisphaera lichenicola TaxID=2029860 RepID=UPI003EB9EA7A
MMSLAEPVTSLVLTADGLANLPDDGIERDLIRGELREWPMTRRNPMHSESETLISHHLWSWVESQPSPRGKVVGGEAGFRLKQDPVTYVGIDVAYISPEMAAAHDRKRKYFDGPPVLAVEILSPSDLHENIVEKVEIYLEVGTVVWVVDPDFRVVAVHRPGETPAHFNERQELDANPYLPGFRVPVSRFFGD